MPSWLMFSCTDPHGIFLLSFIFISVLLLEIADSTDICSSVPVHIACERVMVLLAVFDRSAVELTGHGVEHPNHLAFVSLW